MTLTDDDWTRLKLLQSRLSIHQTTRKSMLYEIVGAKCENQPFAGIIEIQGHREFFEALDQFWQKTQDEELIQKYIQTLEHLTINSSDGLWIRELIDRLKHVPPPPKEPDIVLPNPIATTSDLWISCSGLANAISNLPVFLNKQIAEKNPEIRIDHIPKALNAIRTGLPNLAVLLSKNDYLDAQKSLEELQVRYDRYIDWLNKGHQRTATLDEINNYFKEELVGWIGKSFLPTMERVCSKRTDNFDSNKDKTQ